MGGAQPGGLFQVASESSRFRILGELGAGGMGIVFDAEDLLLGTRVALKTLRRLSGEGLLRFKTEFRALQDLQHPNLVRLDELICHGDQWFFTMERIDGVDFLSYVGAAAAAVDGVMSQTLDDMGSTSSIAGPGAEPRQLTIGATTWPGFDESRLRQSLAQLVQGLGALHRAGKVHRDIKPSNILVTAEGRVVLLDFGVIADVRRGSDGHIVGTPLYMAPEQAELRLVGPAADWYAVGMVLYQALTGRLPFGGSPRDSLQLRRQLEPVPPSRWVADLPPDLDTLCTDLLRLDPAARPAYAEVLRRLSLKPAEASAVSFVGRRFELDELASCFAAVAAGQSRVHVIHGESGAGKTALVSQFIAQLDPSVVVLAGRCWERESVPYKAVDEAIDDLSWYLTRLPPAQAAALLPKHTAALAQLFPVLPREPSIAAAMSAAAGETAPDPRELRARGFVALRQLLASIASSQPVLLAIDDLQWADVDSLALLTELLSPAPQRFMLLATVRSSAGAAGAAEVVPWLPAATRLHLTGLRRKDALELATSLLEGGSLPEEDRSQTAAVIAEESEGNPLFIDELVRRRRTLGAGPIALRLDDALAARVEELAPRGREVLEMVAISGAPLSREIVAAATGLGLEEVTRELAALRAVNLIRSSIVPGGLAAEPFHERIRRAVVHGLATPVKAALHLRLAVALEAQGDDAELLVMHYQEANEPQHAARWAAVAAPRAAAALAFERAVRLFELAAAHLPASVPEAQRLRLGLAEALVNAGHSAAAARAFEAAAAADVGASGELRRKAAEQHLRSGDMDAGFAAAGRVLAPLGMVLPPTPRRALASLLIRRSRLRLRGLGYRERAAGDVAPAQLARIDACYSVAATLGFVDHVRGADFQTRNLLSSLDSGEPYRVARALAFEAAYTAAAGQHMRVRSERLLAQSREIATRIDHPHGLACVEAATGIVGFAVGDWEVARRHCELAKQILRERCLGVAWDIDTVEFVHLWAVLYQGQLGQLASRVGPLLRHAEERGDLLVVTNLHTCFVPLIELAADRPKQALERSTQAAREWTRKGFHLQHYNFEIYSDGQISLYVGEAAQAYLRISRRWPALRASMLPMIQQLRVEALHVRARCALAAAGAARGRDRARWLRAAAGDQRRIAREGASWAQGWVELLGAGIAAQRGEPEEAARLASCAASSCQAAGLELFAAAARRGQGRLLQGNAGAELVAAADAWMQAQGVRNPDRMSAVLAPGLFPG